MRNGEKEWMTKRRVTKQEGGQRQTEFQRTMMAPMTKGCSTPSPSPSLAKDLSQFSAKSSPAFRHLQNFKSRNPIKTSLKPPQKLLQTMSLQTSPSGNHFTIGVNPGAHPDHLVILVNGIIGSADNWRFAAEQFKLKLADTVVIHCSATNSALKTFHGVDVMGHRLAEEVQGIIRETPGVTKISFLAHSLGGLITRYAIGQLYRPPHPPNVLERVSKNPPTTEDGSGVQSTNSGRGNPDNAHEATSTSYGTMAGLEAANFITVATPHLGSRGSRQLPFLFGFSPFEKVAPLMAHWFVGKTGRHLFLTDGDGGGGGLPLLRRMVTDCDEGKFISALKAFQRRTVYANVMYDHMVGWRTSSLRRASELPEIREETHMNASGGKMSYIFNDEDGVIWSLQVRHEPVDPLYPHIVRDEELPPCLHSLPVSIPELPRVCRSNNFNIFEEEMVAGLQQVSWRRVDVSFFGTASRFMAHNAIQVKSPALHKEGADIIQHILDKHF